MRICSTLFVASATFVTLARDLSAALVVANFDPYSTNFDFLAAANDDNAWTDDASTQSANGSPGWFWQNGGSLTYTGGFAFPNSPGAYSLGDGSSGDGTERAMGHYGGASSPFAAWGMVFQNLTGETITEVDISYDGEQWGRGHQADSIRFSYRNSATNITDFQAAAGAAPSGWIANSTLSFNAPQIVAPPTPFVPDPIPSVAISGKLSVSWLPGEYLAIRWYDADDGGATRDSAMGIDNLTVKFSAVPEAAAWRAITLAGLVAVAIKAPSLVRRRTAASCREIEPHRSLAGVRTPAAN